MINPEMRSQLPPLPGKDDVFVRMGMLFIKAFEEMERLEILLDTTKPHIKDYVETHKKYIEDMPMRYLEIVKEYQELLFTQPEQAQEGIEE